MTTDHVIGEQKKKKKERERYRERCSLFDVEDQERQVEHKGQPVAINQEQGSEKTVDSSFGNNVGVEAVAEIDGINVIAFQVRVPNSTNPVKTDTSQ